MDNPGFSLHACNWQLMCKAIDMHVDDYLSAQPFTLSHAAFYDPIRAGDFLLIGTAVSDMTGQPKIELAIDRHQVSDGTFADRICDDWVELIASLPLSEGPILFDRWVVAYQDEERLDPKWADLQHMDYGSQLIKVCKDAMLTSTDVVMVWRL